MRERSTISRRALFAGAAAVPVAAVIPPAAAPTEADAELIATCAAFDALERRILAFYSDGATPIEDDDERDEAIDPLSGQQEKLLDPICAMRAVSLRGMRARAATLVLNAPHVLEPSHHWESRLCAAVLRDLLGTVPLDGGPATIPGAGIDTGKANPDAELIRICDRHIANHYAYNTYGGMAKDFNTDPLWIAYIETSEAVEEAEPQTISGVIALARVAKVEATQPDGEELWDSGTVCDITSKIVDALVRIGGAEHAPSG